MTNLHAGIPAGGDASAAAGRQQRVDEHFRDCAVQWEDIYRGTDVNALIYQERRDAVLSLVEGLGLAGNASVVEVGCGAGAIAVRLAQDGLAVDAIDTVQEMLDRTRAAAAEAGVAAQVHTTLGNINALPLHDSSQDLAIAIGVTPWLESLPAALAELRRVLKPSGRLILSADNRRRLTYTLDPLRFPALSGWRRSLRRSLERAGLWKATETPRAVMYSVREFDAALLQAGFEKLSGRSLGFAPFTFLNRDLFSSPRSLVIHRKLQNLADRNAPGLRNSGSHYIVLARKTGCPR